MEGSQIFKFDARDYPTPARCRRLTEIGFPKTSSHWLGTMEGNRPQLFPSGYLSKGGAPWVAPLATEIIRAMPPFLPIYGLVARLRILVDDCNAVQYYYSDDVRMEQKFGKTLSDNLADMVVRLVDEGYGNFKNGKWVPTNKGKKPEVPPGERIFLVGAKYARLVPGIVGLMISYSTGMTVRVCRFKNEEEANSEVERINAAIVAKASEVYLSQKGLDVSSW